MYSLIGDHSMRLRWVPDSGGYVGRTVSSGSSIRAMRVIVTEQTRIEGAWTAQTLVAELRSWKPGPPRRGDAYRVELTRRSAGVDVAMLLDRTGSMTTADIRNMQDGAIAMLRAFDSRQIWVGLSVLPYGDAQDPCTPGNPQVYPSPGLDPWRITSMSPYHSKPNGRLDPESPIVQAIECLRPSPTLTVTVDGVDRTSAGHTDLGDPMAAAHTMLESEGRDDASDVIVFMTDGEANQPDQMLPCRYFNRIATDAKRSGQVIFTIGYGVGGARCQRDTRGRFRSVFASTNLAAAATRSRDDRPGACSLDENEDGDHYFCEPHGGSLRSTFRQVAAAALETPSRRPCRRGCW
ncbi:MAG: vWA domain-containing protein [Actinomycetota bacterium]